ncbi:MAG: OmpA family protein, partial [Planctomycetia bacterium]|nr:OmpA family protein [Planctomycetia bacterium]
RARDTDVSVQRPPTPPEDLYGTPVGPAAAAPVTAATTPGTATTPSTQIFPAQAPGTGDAVGGDPLAVTLEGTTRSGAPGTTFSGPPTSPVIPPPATATSVPVTTDGSVWETADSRNVPAGTYPSAQTLTDMNTTAPVPGGALASTPTTGYRPLSPPVPMGSAVTPDLNAATTGNTYSSYTTPASRSTPVTTPLPVATDCPTLTSTRDPTPTLPTPPVTDVPPYHEASKIPVGTTDTGNAQNVTDGGNTGNAESPESTENPKNTEDSSGTGIGDEGMEEVDEEEEEIVQPVPESLQEARETDGFDVIADTETVRVILHTDRMFEPDSAEWITGGRTYAEQIWTRVLDAFPDRKIQVTGHMETADDSSDAAETARTLSATRASEVALMASEIFQKPSSQFVAKGLGNAEPRYSTGTPEGTQANNRVEIVILTETVSP